jgi:hypothetical protein
VETSFRVKPLGFLARAADYVMYPLMRILMELNGTPSESPQLTHRWNNHHLTQRDVAWLDPAKMVYAAGINTARTAWSLFRHIPITGWRHYLVVVPARPCEWYPGWIDDRVTGVSRIPQCGKARLLLGPGDVRFFGIDCHTGAQVPLIEVGRGRLGDNSSNERLPLV